MRMMNSMFAFMSLSGISINERPNLRFLKNSVAWRKRRFVFIHFIHMIISVIKVYQNATHHSQVCEPAYEPAPAPKALYDAPY